MANTIQLKRSAVEGNVPTTAQLALGEVGINTFDGKMFIKKDDGVESIVEITSTPAPIYYNDTLDLTYTPNPIPGSNTTGYSNVAVGGLALSSNTTGNTSVALGFESLMFHTTGSQNTAVGIQTLSNVTTGSNNCAVGAASLINLGTPVFAPQLVAERQYVIVTVSDTDFTLIGAADNNIGTTFTATGPGTGTGTARDTSQANNTAVGSVAGSAIYGGSNNTIIGPYVGLSYMDSHIVLATGDGANRLIYDGTKWSTNEPVEVTELTILGELQTSGGGGTSGQVLTSAGPGVSPTWTTVSGVGGVALNDLTDVILTTPNPNDILVFDGADWINVVPLVQYDTVDTNLLCVPYPMASPLGSYNIAMGDTALISNTAGSYNVAIGHSALTGNTSGGSNTAVGFSVLSDNTIGYNNTAMGDSALKLNTEGYNNTATGYASLVNNTTGYNNTGVGQASLYNVNTGYNNTAVGVYSLASITTASNNTAVGHEALYNALGEGNTAIGASALYSSTSGVANVGVGASALYSTTVGYGNTVIGDNAAMGLGGSHSVTTISVGYTYVIITTGDTDFVSIGAVDNNPGTTFVASGVGTGTGTVLGVAQNNNIFIGSQAGLNVIVGENNTIIGPYAGTPYMFNHIELATGEGTSRLTFDGTWWTTIEPVELNASLNCTSELLFSSDPGTAGMILHSNGAGMAPAWDVVSALEVTYDNTTSLLVATDVQAAIDEVAAGIQAILDNINGP
jgi:trimeric autotransporter adhesin